MRERTRGFAIATRDLGTKSGELARITQELAAVVALVEDSVALGDVLIDRGLRPVIRRSILDELLTGRVDSRVVALVGYVVETEFAGDVPEVLAGIGEILGSTYVLGDGIETATGARARGYARAIMLDLDRDALLLMLDELIGVTQLLADNILLRRALSGAGGDAEQRVHIVEDLFEERVSAATLAVIRAVVATSNPRSLEESLERIIGDCSVIIESQVARVTLARQVDEVYRSRITSTLEHRIGRELIVEWRVDESLIGGMIAVIGDRVYDVSVARELQRAQQLLAGR
ncbi:F0F1 ATP synthase subunit delta [Ferrimicrobium sp.]|uniref:F0F1 ATP synthase subunit delta n=1 Tax=Ferrimicrobium sp. TaxID=2926050 RepID=UPI002622E38C|nr:F0F1 ATP synthase subunit delta [Ferrimicrobium sp.]